MPSTVPCRALAASVIAPGGERVLNRASLDYDWRDANVPLLGRTPSTISVPASLIPYLCSGPGGAASSSGKDVATS